MNIDPTLPAWLNDLPRDSRDFVVPAEAAWLDGVPAISKVDSDRKFVQGMNRACGVCGFRIPVGSTAYRAFAQGDAAHMRQFERQKSHDLGGPLHLSCVLYSAIVCPYLRERNSRLKKDSNINPGARRGTRAAIIGFENFGLLVPQDNDEQVLHFAYLKIVEDIGYRDGSELLARLDVAIASDAEIIDVTSRRFYWSGGRDDNALLLRDAKEASLRLRKLKGQYREAIAGQGTFGAVFPE